MESVLQGDESRVCTADDDYCDSGLRGDLSLKSYLGRPGDCCSAKSGLCRLCLPDSPEVVSSYAFVTNKTITIGNLADIDVGMASMAQMTFICQMIH